MRVLITGGAGFIGRALASRWRSAHPGIWLGAVDTAPMGWNGFGAFDEVTSCCFSAPAGLAAAKGADVIVHLAAQTTVQGSVLDPALTWDENVCKTMALLEVLRRQNPGAHLIFASTGGAIAGDHDGPVNEATLPRPLSPYGASKLAVEGLLSAYAGSFDLTATALRFANVYGPGSGDKTSVIAAFCRAIRDRAPLEIRGDGEQSRDFIHVDDICDAIIAAARGRCGGVFQLGSGQGTSISQLAALMAEIAPWPVAIARLPGLSGEVRHNRADIALAEAALKFRPKVPLAIGLAETLGWFLSEFEAAPRPAVGLRQAG